MARTIQVTIDCADPWELSRFWAEALDYVIPGPPGVELATGEDPLQAWGAFLGRAGVPEDQWRANSAIEDAEGTGPRIFFQRVPEAKQAKNRLHLDLRAAPGLQGDERMAALEGEAERLVTLGATRVQRFEPELPLTAGFLVMQDPEGNEFCLD